MKFIKYLLISAGAVSLLACNVGDNTTSNNQTISGSNPVSIQGIATNCTNSTGTCSISVSYIATNSSANGATLSYKYGNGPITPLLINGSSSQCSSIPATNASATTCNAGISINSLSGSQTVTFYAGSTIITNGSSNTSINIGS